MSPTSSPADGQRFVLGSVRYNYRYARLPCCIDFVPTFFYNAFGLLNCCADDIDKAPHGPVWEAAQKEVKEVLRDAAQVLAAIPMKSTGCECCDCSCCPPPLNEGPKYRGSTYVGYQLGADDVLRYDGWMVRANTILAPLGLIAYPKAFTTTTTAKGGMDPQTGIVSQDVTFTRDHLHIVFDQCPKHEYTYRPVRPPPKGIPKPKQAVVYLPGMMGGMPMMTMPQGPQLMMMPQGGLPMQGGMQMQGGMPMQQGPQLMMVPPMAMSRGPQQLTAMMPPQGFAMHTMQPMPLGYAAPPQMMQSPLYAPPLQQPMPQPPQGSPQPPLEQPPAVEQEPQPPRDEPMVVSDQPASTDVIDVKN